MLKETADAQKNQRIKELEDQLYELNQEKAKNNVATDILSGFISKGKAR